LNGAHPLARLPERASFEYLKKLAKNRLDELRQLDPDAKLAAAQLAAAREHGFSSWRALKAEIDRRVGGSCSGARKTGAYERPSKH
jgi:hypothetical protein